MKRIIASAGLVAVGATGLQAAYAPGLTPLETAKPWSVSATVRGFYDDNFATAPSSFTGKKDSFGLEFSPAAAINVPLEQTFLGASYVYTMRYYEGRPNHHFDHSHEATLKLDHRFSERYRLTFNDAFAYSEEPEVIQPTGTALSVFTRTDASALRNRANIELTAQLTELFGLRPGYQNIWYNFLDSGVGSHSAALDRVEHYFHLDATYQAQEHLIALVGYEFGVRDYTSNELLAPGSVFTGDSRDSQSHKGYVGAEWAMSSQLNASAKVGVQFTTYDSLTGNDEVSPWADLNATYTYLPGSYVQIGIRHDRSATDFVGDATDVVRDQETTSLYGSVNHRVTREITASVLGQFQRGTFSGGSFDGDVENFLTLGLNIEYRINPNWAVEGGYNFDRLDSDVGRSFTRNRVYLGASATF